MRSFPRDILPGYPPPRKGAGVGRSRWPILAGPPVPADEVRIHDDVPGGRCLRKRDPRTWLLHEEIDGGRTGSGPMAVRANFAYKNPKSRVDGWISLM